MILLNEFASIKFFLKVESQQHHSYNATTIDILKILITFELANHDQFEHKPACC